jgi:hypothetical protein
VKKMRDELDLLLEEAITAEVESIDISDIEIEEEWNKLAKLRNVRRSKGKYKMIAGVAAVIIVSIMIFPLFTRETYSWKIFNIFKIQENENNKIIDEVSTSNEIESNKNMGLLSVSIDDARDIIDFDFKELPFEIKEVKVYGRSEIIIHYANDLGLIRFIQELQGMERSSTTSIPKGSKVSSFTSNKIEYNFINIKDKMAKLIWNDSGIKYTIDVKYPLNIENAKTIIESLK